MDATVSIICLVIIAYCLFDLWFMERRYYKPPSEPTEQETEALRKSIEESFRLKIKLQEKMMEDMQKPPLWASMIKGSKNDRI